MSELLERLSSFTAPAVIVAIVSMCVGSFLSYLAYRLNRKKERFETHRYAQSIFRDLFDLDRRTSDELAEFRERIRALDAPVVVEAVTTGDDLLLTIDRLFGTMGATPELHRIASQASNMHYALQAQKGLFISSLRELLEKDEGLLNSYERYRAYHAMLVDGGALGDPAEKWRLAATKFYKAAKASGDCASMIRMGITLAGTAIEMGRRAEAEEWLSEISDDEVLARSGMNREFLKRRIAFLTKKMLSLPNSGSQPTTGGASRRG